MNKKNKYKDKNNVSYRVGKRIRAKRVQLIDEKGNNLGVTLIVDALKRAEEAGLDLVEIKRGEMPLCKILNYGKMQYKKSKQAKKKEHKTREIQLRPKIAENDFECKIKNARKFLEKGSNVHLLVKFRGREFMHKDIGVNLLKKAQQNLQDVSSVMRDITIGHKRMDMLLGSKAK